MNKILKGPFRLTKGGVVIDSLKRNTTTLLFACIVYPFLWRDTAVGAYRCIGHFPVYSSLSGDA
jgi:hypothetical protein